MKTLYLSQDPALIDAQFTGTRLTPLQAQALRDDVSTDEITPVAILSHYDEQAGRLRPHRPGLRRFAAGCPACLA